jgi:fumarate hydratase subunit beta
MVTLIILRKRTGVIMDIITPISENLIADLQVGDAITLSGYILCGRDMVLPMVVKMIENHTESDLGLNLHGQVIFHTAVSPAGIGPTSSNKLEIESSIAPLSKAGIKMHLGKGELHKETVEVLNQYNSVYAIIPPVTALLKAKTLEQKAIAFPEYGMEALHLIKVDKFPIIIGAAHGRSIYE